MGDSDTKRLDMIEADIRSVKQESNDIKITLTRLEVLMEQMVLANSKYASLEMAVADHERNWRIVKWLVGGSWVGIVLLLLRVSGFL